MHSNKLVQLVCPQNKPWKYSDRGHRTASKFDNPIIALSFNVTAQHKDVKNQINLALLYLSNSAHHIISQTRNTFSCTFSITVGFLATMVSVPSLTDNRAPEFFN